MENRTILKAIEEMAELSVELAKYLNGSTDKKRVRKIRAELKQVLGYLAKIKKGI